MCVCMRVCVRAYVCACKLTREVIDAVGRLAFRAMARVGIDRKNMVSRTYGSGSHSYLNTFNGADGRFRSGKKFIVGGYPVRITRYVRPMFYLWFYNLTTQYVRSVRTVYFDCSRWWEK